MSKIFPIVLPALALMTQGCAHTTYDVRALGALAQVEASKPYADTTSCLMREIDGKVNRLVRGAPIDHTLQIHEEGGYAEIVAPPFYYVVSIHSKGEDRSLVKIYVSDDMIFRSKIADHLKRAAENCNAMVDRRKP